MSRATVCFFSGDITRGGGTEAVAAQLANALHRTGRYRVLILNLTLQRKEPFFPIDEGIPLTALSGRWINPGPGYLRLLPRLRSYLKRERVDILIDIDIVLDVLSVLCRGRGDRRIRIVSWEHFHYLAERRVLYRRMILRLFAARTDALVTLTEGDAEDFRTALPRHRRILRIYNPMPEPVRIPFAERKKRILTAGHLIHVKGIDYLLEIAERVLVSHPDWTWLVAGDGELLEAARQSARERGLASRLLFPGAQKNMPDLYRASSIYVMTSRSEGLPMTLLEAKAYALPTVSFDIATGPSEILSDGVNGYLVPPFDTAEMAERIAALMDDDALRESFSDHALLGAEKFSAKRITGQWLELIESLLDGARSS